MNMSAEGNKIFSFYNDAKKLIKGEMVIPRFVSLWLTTSCDLQCLYCYFNNKNKEKQFADTNKVKRLIDELVSLGIESLELSGGGEPTLHPDCFDIIEYAYKKGLKVGLLTNGFKFDFYKIMYLTYVRFGVDSTTDKQFLKIKGGKDGRFTELINQIKKLLEFRKGREFPSIGIKFMLNKLNYTCIEDMVSLAFTTGVDYCHFKGTHSDKNALTSKQRLDLESIINRKKESYPNFVFGSVNRCVAKVDCFMAPIHTVITSTGDVLNCCYFYEKDKVVGNAFKTSFSTIWFSDNHKKVINSIKVSDCNKVDCRFSHYNNEMNSILKANKYNLSFI